MKQLNVFLLAILLAGMVSCSKKDDDNKKNPGKPAPIDTTIAYDYKLGTVADVELTNGGAAVQTFDVTYLAGTTPEKVTLDVSGLPAGITDSIAPVSGTPTYSAFITYTAAGAAQGTYAVKIIATSESGLVREAAFNLSIANRKDLLLGKWKRTQNAVDSNNNAVMDPNEIVDFQLDANYTFNADGTGTLVSANLGGAPLPLPWSLQNNDRELKLGQAVYTIDVITKTDLIIHNVIGGQIQWMLMKKQD